MKTIIKWLFNKKVRKYIWLAIIAPAILTGAAQMQRNVSPDTAWVLYHNQFKVERVVNQRLSTSVAWGNLIAERVV